MSITRDSNFYYEIVATLTKGLKEKDYEIPNDVIRSVLSELFDSVAIHVWSRPDVYRVAWEAGWPISPTMADEILADVEAHANSEYGITWLTFENAVAEFYAELDWDHLDPQEDEQCIGFFLVCLANHPKASKSMLHLTRTSFSEAVKKAERLVEDSGQAVICYSIPKEELPLLETDWLEKHAHKLKAYDIVEA